MSIKAALGKKNVLICLGVVFLLFIVGFKVIRVFARGHKNQHAASVLRDVNYVPGGQNPFQTMDIYFPKKSRSKTLPLIVWIHGGAWLAGDKNHPPAEPMLERGYAVVSLNYRLSTQEHHPAQINDCKAAIRYLRAHAKEFKIDPNRIGVWGHSAGGHLSALVGTSGDAKELEGNLGNNEQSSRVQAAAEWAGPSDLTTCALQAPKNCKIDFSKPDNPIAVLMGPEQSPVAYLSASPVQYVSKDDPPFLILHAEDDDVVPVGQAKELSELLARLEVPHKTHISPDGGHALSKPGFINETLDFFDEKLGKN